MLHSPLSLPPPPGLHGWGRRWGCVCQPCLCALVYLQGEGGGLKGRLINLPLNSTQWMKRLLAVSAASVTPPPPDHRPLYLSFCSHWYLSSYLGSNLHHFFQCQVCVKQHRLSFQAWTNWVWWQTFWMDTTLQRCTMLMSQRLVQFRGKQL